jgi:hypothetical protein
VHMQVKKYGLGLRLRLSNMINIDASFSVNDIYNTIQAMAERELQRHI